LIGEDKSYDRRAFLLYDGIHYDPLIQSYMGGVSCVGLFPVADQSVESEAEEIMKKQYEASALSFYVGLHLSELFVSLGAEIHRPLQLFHSLPHLSQSLQGRA